jgi:hypothetical protein
MRFLTVFSLLVIGVLSESARATYVFFTVPDAPKEGLEKLVYHMTIENCQAATGYYWADQANFVHGGHAIYMGLQPREKANKYRAVFSVFGKGARGISEHTSPGADGGAGASGAIDYPWVKGRRYTLQMELIKSDQAHEDEQAWEGSVTDEKTHETTVIARYAVPLSWGHLSPKSVFFAEYFIYNDAKYHGAHPATRPEQPYAMVLAEAPVGSADGVSHDGKISGMKGSPDNDKLEKQSDTAATVETGLSAKSKAGPTVAPTTTPAE